MGSSTIPPRQPGRGALLHRAAVAALLFLSPLASCGSAAGAQLLILHRTPRRPSSSSCPHRLSLSLRVPYRHPPPLQRLGAAPGSRNSLVVEWAQLRQLAHPGHDAGGRTKSGVASSSLCSNSPSTNLTAV
uniref:Uncharacterized protein n=1 Tax=Setaria italica TaxID=4555 RepID=K3XZZ1_SETIT